MYNMVKLKYFASVSCLLIFLITGLTFSKTEMPTYLQSATFQTQSEELTGQIISEPLSPRLSTLEGSCTQPQETGQPAITKADTEVDGMLSSAMADGSPELVENKESQQSDAWFGTVTIDGVNFRKSPEKADNIIGLLNEGQVVAVISSSGEWYNVKTTEGIYGWVNSSYVKKGVTLASRGSGSRSSVPSPAPATASTPKPAATPKATSSPAPVKPSATKTPAPSPKPTADSNASLGQQIVNYSKKFLGVPYVWGGETPSGFDCSGFTKYVFAHFGIRLNRVAADQAKQGTKVQKSDLKPGDLVFFDTNGNQSYINHVGIYIGGGNFIHAASGGKKVMITELNSSFYKDKFMTARRMIK